jgi:hypothetical protein
MKKTVKYLGVVALSVILAGPVVASERFELIIGSSAIDGEGVNGAEIDTDADAYAGRFMQDFGTSGYFSGGVSLQRIDLTDVNGGAWAVDALARVQRKRGVTKAYLAGALGGIFTDIEEVPVPVEIDLGEEGTASGMGMASEQDVGLRATGLFGFQLFFSRAQRFGVGIEYAYSKPIGDGFMMQDDKGGRIFLILPAGG